MGKCTYYRTAGTFSHKNTFTLSWQKNQVSKILLSVTQSHPRFEMPLMKGDRNHCQLKCYLSGRDKRLISFR